MATDVVCLALSASIDDAPARPTRQSRPAWRCTDSNRSSAGFEAPAATGMPPPSLCGRPDTECMSPYIVVRAEPTVGGSVASRLLASSSVWLGTELTESAGEWWSRHRLR